METPAGSTSAPAAGPLRPLPVVGGDLALDFANTVDDPWGPGCFDHVGDLPRLLGWASLTGLLTEDRVGELLVDLAVQPATAEVRLHAAHVLRDALGALFGAVADGTGLPPDAWDTVRTAAADAVAHASLRVEDGHVALGWADDLDGVLRRVAYAGHTLLTGDQLHRVKRCAACPWVYLDRSKNLSRRWCSMDDCGKNVKMRRYVERRAARRSADRAAGA